MQLLTDYQIKKGDKMKHICKNCKSWVDGCCMQTEFEVSTEAEQECFIIGFVPIKSEELEKKDNL